MDDYVRLGFFGLWVRFDNKKIAFIVIIAKRIFVLKGNKGSTLFTLNIGGFSICFVNSHLSAHEDQSKRRVAVRFRVICFIQKIYSLICTFLMKEHSKIFNNSILLGNSPEKVSEQE